MKDNEDVSFSMIHSTFLQLGFIFAQYQTDNMQKFCKRLLMKYPNNLRLLMISGNSALTSGYYKHAVRKFHKA